MTAFDGSEAHEPPADETTASHQQAFASEKVAEPGSDLTRTSTAKQEALVLDAVKLDDGDNSIADEQHEDDLEKGIANGSAASGSPVERSQTAQGWTGPDDPGDPMNWPRFKKWRHVIATASLSFAVTVGTSIVAPANDDIQRQYGVSRTAAILPLTVFVLGLAFGPVIGAPLSEKFGRQPIYTFSPVIYMLFLVGAGFSKSFGGVLVCRLLAGAAGAPVLAVGSGTNSDMFTAKNRAVAGVVYLVAPFLGPALGPVIGGFCAQYKDYAWTQWCLIFITLAAWAQCMLTEESYKKAILKKRAKKLGLEPPPEPAASGLGLLKLILMMTVMRPLGMLVTEPMVFLFSLYTAFAFAVLFAFFAAYPYTFVTQYQFNTWQIGLMFLPLGVGVLLASLVSVLFDRFLYKPKLKAAIARGETKLPPEERLYAGMVGAFCLPVGLFWFAWTARSDIHWFSPALAGIPFACGNLALFTSAGLYLIDVYGPLGGASAMAANGLLRYGLGAVFPLWTVQMYEKLGIDWATSLLGFIAILMLPIPFAFYKYGPYFRGKSKLAVE